VVAPFVKVVTTGLPYVTLKWAQTLDGFIATRTGNSQWITGPAARRIVHRQRAASDAVMVGIGTALADDPQLNVRGLPAPRELAAVVVDPHLRLPVSSALARAAATRPVVLLCHEAAAATAAATPLRDRGVQLVALPSTDDGSIDLRAGLAWLVEHRAATNVLVEGGQGVISRLVSQGLADRALVFVAPRMLGDDGARQALRRGPIPSMQATVNWRLTRQRQITGGDLLLDYACQAPAATEG